MDIKKSIEQNVNQTVESLVNEFENGYMAYVIGNEIKTPFGSFSTK